MQRKMNNPADCCLGNLAPFLGKMKAVRHETERTYVLARRDVRCCMCQPTQKQSSFRDTWGFLTKHLKKSIFGSVQLPHESLSCVSSLRLSYPLSEGYQDIGEQNPSLCAGSPSSCGSIGDLPPSQEHPYNNPPWHVQLVNCKSLTFAGEGCAPNIGLRIWCGRKAETFLERFFLAPLLAHFPAHLLPSFFTYLRYFFFISLRCSASRFKLILFSLFPILVWLPKYKIKDYILPDVLGGLSAGTIQVPQGEMQRLSGSPRGDSTLPVQVKVCR